MAFLSCGSKAFAISLGINPLLLAWDMFSWNAPCIPYKYSHSCLLHVFKIIETKAKTVSVHMHLLCVLEGKLLFMLPISQQTDSQKPKNRWIDKELVNWFLFHPKFSGVNACEMFWQSSIMLWCVFVPAYSCPLLTNLLKSYILLRSGLAAG